MTHMFEGSGASRPQRVQGRALPAGGASRRKNRRRCGLAALPLLLPYPALAHAFLASAAPRVGGAGPAPREVVLTFSEAIEPDFSAISVRNGDGAAVDDGQTRQEGGAATLAVGLKALPPGTYAVTWHATSVDTHRTEGRFTFTVTP